MRGKYQKFLFFLVLGLLSVFVLGGCATESSDTDKTKDSEEAGIKLYYLNAQEDGFKKISYLLENPEDPLLASYEIAYKLSDTETNNTDQYKASVFDGVVVNAITINDGEETIDFGAGYEQLSAAKEILCRTALVRSLVQIEDVKSVSFTVNGETLLGTDEVPVGAMTGSTFITDGDAQGIYHQKEKVTLYYANTKGNGLVPVKTTLRGNNNIPLETRALEALLKDPKKKKCRVALPDGLKINQTQIMGNICYVDLSEEIETAVAEVEEKVTVYAMVNTITSLGTASQVQFSINGKKVETINDFDSFGKLMTCDYSLCD